MQERRKWTIAKVDLEPLTVRAMMWLPRQDHSNMVLLHSKQFCICRPPSTITHLECEVRPRQPGAVQSGRGSRSTHPPALPPPPCLGAVLQWGAQAGAHARLLGSGVEPAPTDCFERSQGDLHPVGV